MPYLPSRTDRLRLKRDELADRLERLTRDRMRRTAPLEADFAEQAVQRENDEVLDRLDAATRAELAEVDHALERLAAGTGALCEICGETIDAQRLSALPQATRCRRCAGTGRIAA